MMTYRVCVRKPWPHGGYVYDGYKPVESVLKARISEILKKGEWEIGAVMPEDESYPNVSEDGWNRNMQIAAQKGWLWEDVKHKYLNPDAADLMGLPAPITPATPGPRKPAPVICPEIWAKPRTDIDYMQAVRDMCRPTKG